MKKEYKAVLALLISTILGALIAIVSKLALKDVGPFEVLFLRFFFSALTLLPFLLKEKPWQNKHFLSLVFLSILATINTSFFIWGIQYTTATVSQILYAAMPLLIIIISRVFWKEKFPSHKILGVLVGLGGLIYIVYLSAIEKGTTISGSIVGNVAVLIAMLSWMFYIIYSKRLLSYFTPLVISTVSVMVSLVIASFLFLLEILLEKYPVVFNLPVLLAGIYLGIFGGTLFYIIYQYGIKYSSPLTASLTSYLQPIIAAIFAYFLLSERLTIRFIVGSLFVFAGIFITTTLEFHHRKRLSDRLN